LSDRKTFQSVKIGSDNPKGHLHCARYWQTDGASQNNHQSVSRCMQAGTEMFSVGNEKYWSTAAAPAVSAACSMLAVRRHRKPCRRFVDVRGTTRSPDDKADHQVGALGSPQGKGQFLGHLPAHCEYLA